jgi:hypothetical protein
MNRREFFAALFGSLPALPIISVLFRQDKPLSYWAGTTIPRDVPWDCLTPKAQQRIVDHGGLCYRDIESRHLAHPFQNNGASTGVCRICGGAVTAHESMLLFPYPTTSESYTFKKIPAWASWA